MPDASDGLVKSTKFKARELGKDEAYIAYVESFHSDAQRRNWAFYETGKKTPYTMKAEHVKYLRCPDCQKKLILFQVMNRVGNDIETGILQCSKCKADFNIIRYIPRFVGSDNYASGFGLQWTKHAKTQYDSHTGLHISEKRFFGETNWERDLTGEIILEVGSGSGRFTEQAAATGAMTISIDYSNAVESNYASNGHMENILIVQADIYKMPFIMESFDKLFCFGVLQHTPDVKKAFMQLPRYLRGGGLLAIDIYRKPRWYELPVVTKHWVRPFTKRMPPEHLYQIITRYIQFMWPMAKIINKLPYGRFLNRSMLIADYRGCYDLSEEMLKEWAILDTFDMLSPSYDSPQNIDTIKKWFNEAQLKDIDVIYGNNGIEGRATK